MIDFLDVLAGLFCYVLAFSLVSYLCWMPFQMVCQISDFSMFQMVLSLCTWHLACCRVFSQMILHSSCAWCLPLDVFLNCSGWNSVNARLSFLDIVHPGRLTWNIIIEVGKIIFLSKWVIWMFHVNLPGCIWVGLLSLATAFRNVPFRFRWPDAETHARLLALEAKGLDPFFPAGFLETPQNESLELCIFFPWCFWAFFFKTMGQLGH